MTTQAAAECHGIKVPQSPMITAGRAARINAARYEGQEIAGALRVVRPGDRVLELGAGIGLVGAIAARNRNPEKVLSFEANLDLIGHIEALYRMNGLGGRIEVRNAVLLSEPRSQATIPFHVRSSYLGSSLIDGGTRATRQIDVPTARFEDVQRIFSPSVLLMDIEGGELEFLRHAALDGLRAIVIEFHPAVYGKAGMRECKYILTRAGFGKLPAQSTRLVWTCVRDPALRAPAPDGGWSCARTLHQNVTIVPPRVGGLVQDAGLLDCDNVHIAQGALWRNGRALTTAPAVPEGPLPRRKGTWLWGGVLWKHFGHFMVESTARLWAFDSLEDQIDGVLFIPKRARNAGEVEPLHRDFLSHMGIEAPIACVGTPEVVDRLIVPGQGFGLGQMITGTEAFRASMHARLAKNIRPAGSDRLYISRSGLPAGRGTLIGEKELERHLAAEGYAVYHPERHDLRNQIATYRAARRIIAAEGSALHLLAMVAAPETRVAIVARRPSGATRNLEEHLRAFAGITPRTISYLSRCWKPKGGGKPRLWKSELDMDAVQSALMADGFVTDRQRPWQSLTLAEVRTRLGDNFEVAT